MQDIQITGYYYRRKYDSNMVAFTYQGEEYLTNGKIISKLDRKYFKTLLPIDKFDTSEICQNLDSYKEYCPFKQMLMEALLM